MLLNAGERGLLERLLEHLLRNKARFQAEPEQDRKKRLRRLREQKKRGCLSADDQRMLDGLEGSSFYLNAYACVSRPKPPGKRAANTPETTQLYLAMLVHEKLYPDGNSLEFLENQAGYSSANARSLEMLLRTFERDYIATGKLAPLQLIESEFSRFKASEVAQMHPELYQGFPRGRIPPRNPLILANMMRITESEEKLLQSICKLRFNSRHRKPAA